MKPNTLIEKILEYLIESQNESDIATENNAVSEGDWIPATEFKYISNPSDSNKTLNTYKSFSSSEADFNIYEKYDSFICTRV